MPLDSRRQFVPQGGDIVGNAEGTVALVPARPPRDLADFRRGQPSRFFAVILARAGKGDMVDFRRTSSASP